MFQNKESVFDIRRYNKATVMYTLNEKFKTAASFTGLPMLQF